VLGPERNLHVVALRVLAPAAVGQAAPMGTAFYRHALEIEMTGTFLDLLKYLDDVEALPWRLSWNGVELKTLSYPQVQLRGTLYTVNASPTFFSF
jgi:MSHA biogenesis protein MshJ